MTDFAIRSKIEEFLIDWFSGRGAEVIEGCVSTEGGSHDLGRLADDLAYSFKVEVSR